ncbi:uncharacterized protein TNIN_202411 [Trichonephila inaurata madagascariensis]|uniref:Uncharacterized protein n=1 Tax=Trichonephila inaurata madagascariensis TaxID=2747483 RepID=A0A8X6YN57_9ARAC|nr:uncharacterized protein TNIN_202411 [Trichonephila inaurata madagascariensis]
MGMGCPFHCSGDRATSTVPTSNKASSKETTLNRQKTGKIGENPKLCSLSEEHQDENESEEENLSLKTLTTAVKVLTSPPKDIDTFWIVLLLKVRIDSYLLENASKTTYCFKALVQGLRSMGDFEHSGMK